MGDLPSGSEIVDVNHWMMEGKFSPLRRSAEMSLGAAGTSARATGLLARW